MLTVTPTVPEVVERAKAARARSWRRTRNSTRTEPSASKRRRRPRKKTRVMEQTPEWTFILAVLPVSLVSKINGNWFLLKLILDTTLSPAVFFSRRFSYPFISFFVSFLILGFDHINLSINNLFTWLIQSLLPVCAERYL